MGFVGTFEPCRSRCLAPDSLPEIKIFHYIIVASKHFPIRKSSLPSNEQWVEIISERSFLFSIHFNFTRYFRNISWILLTLQFWIKEQMTAKFLVKKLNNYIQVNSVNRILITDKSFYWIWLEIWAVKAATRGHSTTTWTEFCHLLTLPPVLTVFVSWVRTKTNILSI